jgi:hypothetical protein
MTKSQLFRKMIREEVQKAIREEMPRLLKEIKSVKEPVKTLKESTEDMYGVPLTLNQKPTKPKKPAAMPFDKSNPLNNLLNETFLSMTSDDAAGFGYDAQEQHPSMVFQPTVDRVGGVEDMLASARGGGSLEAVQVNVVPDFSGLMDKLLKQGDIK